MEFESKQPRRYDAMQSQWPSCLPAAEMGENHMIEIAACDSALTAARQYEVDADSLTTAMRSGGAKSLLA